MSKDLRFETHGTFEWKLTEMVYECWRMRIMAEGNYKGIKRFAAAVESLYLVLPGKVKAEVEEAYKRFQAAKLGDVKLDVKLDPLQLKRLGYTVLFRNADQLLRLIVESLDRNNLLVKAKPVKRKGEITPEEVPDYVGVS